VVAVGRIVQKYERYSYIQKENNTQNNTKTKNTENKNTKQENETKRILKKRNSSNHKVTKRSK